MRQAREALEQRLQRSPLEEEVAAELGVSVEAYQRGRLEAEGVYAESLDALGQGRDVLEAMVQDGDGLGEHLERAELGRLVRRAMLELPDREREVMSLYYEQGLLRQIGAELGMCIATAGKVKTQATERLRKALRGRWPRRGEEVRQARYDTAGEYTSQRRTG
jgi:RNA polymerase sigma factor FliA